MRRRRPDVHRVDLTVDDVAELLALAAIAVPDPATTDASTLALWHKARAAVDADRPTLVSVWQ